MREAVCCIVVLLAICGCKESTPKTVTNSVGMKLVYIPPGEFWMGPRDSAEELGEKANSYPEELAFLYPQHHVKISKGFYMGTTEITQSQYKQVMDVNPSYMKGQDLPVNMVSWEDAVEFCRRLSKSEGREYRLPTEAEWEYACRAGTTTPFNTGETITTSQANYDDTLNGTGKTGAMPVGSFQPNAFGLYDMHGNVWEHCQDWYGENYYSTIGMRSAIDPQGPSNGRIRVVRGGSWWVKATTLRSAWRRSEHPAHSDERIGFRIVLDLN